jgi:hypothetical protein
MQIAVCEAPCEARTCSFGGAYIRMLAMCTVSGGVQRRRNTLVPIALTIEARKFFGCPGFALK